MFPQDKFSQLVALITQGVLTYDTRSGQSQFLSILPEMWNGWSVIQSVVYTYPDDVTKMATDYLSYKYKGGNKPEWVGHLGF